MVIKKRWNFLVMVWLVFGLCHCQNSTSDSVWTPKPSESWVPTPLPTQDCSAPWSWSNPIRIPGNSANEVTSIATDKSGNLYATGYLHGQAAVDNLGPIGDSTAFLKKWSPKGDLLWSQELNTQGTDIGESLAIHEIDGRVFLAGRTTGSFAPFVNQGQFDTFVTSFAPTGEPLSLIQVGDERPQHPLQLRWNPAGMLLLVGYDDIYVEQNSVLDWANPFWNRFQVKDNFSLAWLDGFSDRTTHPDYGVGGTWLNDQEFLTITDKGVLQGIEINLYQSNGSAKDTIPVKPIFYIGTMAPSLKNPNHLYLVVEIVRLLQLQVVLMKFDLADKKPLWVADLGIPFVNPSSTDPHSIFADENDQVYVAGETSAPLPGFTQQGDWDIFVQKFDGQTGTELARFQYGQPDILSYGSTIAVDSCNRAFVAGYQGPRDIDGRVYHRTGIILPVQLQEITKVQK